MCCRRTDCMAPGRRAFSLIEVMVVLVIVAMAATLVTINVRGAMGRAKRHAARTEIATLVDAIQEFHLIHNRYPASDEGLGMLTQTGPGQSEPLIEGELPRDPWGNPYEYLQPGLNGPYEIISYGADGRPGGADADADVVSSDLRSRGE